MKKFFIVVFLLTHCVFVSTKDTAQLLIKQFPPQEIHEVLFNLYFPENEQLSTTEKKIRYEWKNNVWLYLKSQPKYMALLDQLQPTSMILPEDIKLSFLDLIEQGPSKIHPKRIKEFQYKLRRHENNSVRKFAATIRQLYSYLTYSGHVTTKIAGNYHSQKDCVSNHAEYPLPTSTLVLQNNQILDQRGDIDYLIIGSGPAGSLIAHELIMQNPEIRVLLLDSGSLIIPQSVVTEISSDFMESNNTRTTITGGINIRNGRAFGGGTIVNLDLAFSPLLPQIKHQIQSWIDNNCMPASLIHENSNDWKKLTEAYEYISTKIGTRKVQLDEVNINNNLLLQGISTATTYQLNAHKSDQQSKVSKISALDIFIMPAVSKGLQILPDTQVNKIIYTTNNNTVTALGVEITFQKPLGQNFCITNPNHFAIRPGDTASINARNIIVCAGALGSAEILLRSNIRNKNIGHGITIHPSMGIYGRFNQEIDALSGLPASVYAACEDPNDKYFFEAMSAEPGFVALINPGSGEQILDLIRDIKYLGGFGIMLIDSPNFNNRVYLDSSTNLVEVDYTLQPTDKIRFKKALARGVEILFAQGAYQVYLPSSEALLSNDNEYVPLTSVEQILPAINNLKFIENANLISSAHMQGSNKIGKSSDRAVVSHNFKVWDQSTQQEFNNLYVCDSSIFPTSVGANPMQSIYTFAKLFIDQHLKSIK